MLRSSIMSRDRSKCIAQQIFNIDSKDDKFLDKRSTNDKITTHTSFI